VSGDSRVIPQLVGSAIIPGTLRQIFTACSRGDQDQLLSTLRFVRALSQNAAQSPESSESLAVVQLMVDCGIVEKLVNMLVNCPTFLPDPDTAQLTCGLCLATLLQFEPMQNLMISLKSSFSSLFALFRIKNEQSLLELLSVLFALLSKPRVGDICVDNGLLVALPSIVVHDSVPVQSLSLKIIVTLIKVLSNKHVLCNQTLLSSLHRASSGSANEAVRGTAFKIMNIINTL